jgi:hypothetical protein
VSECPSTCASVSMRTPRFKRSLANVRRSVCGLIADTFSPFASLREPSRSCRGNHSDILDVLVVHGNDQRLHHLDGLRLFGAPDAGELPDGVHPSPAGYARTGERVVRLIGTFLRAG